MSVDTGNGRPTLSSTEGMDEVNLGNGKGFLTSMDVFQYRSDLPES